MNRSKDALPALTGLRFLAALTVTVGHFTLLHVLPMPAWLMARGGFLDVRPAVVLFFVLSGFVLSYNYAGTLTRDGVKSYLVNRLARVYPVHLFCLALTVLFVAAVALTGHRSYIGWFGLADSPHPARSLALSLVVQTALLNAWTPFRAIVEPWNGLTWSLSCEGFFYLTFPWVLGRVQGLSMRGALGVMAGAFVAEGVILEALRHVHLPRHVFAAAVFYQFPLVHFPEFIIGVAAAVWYSAGGREWLQRPGRAAFGAWGSLALVTLIGYTVPKLVHGPLPVSYPESPFFAVLILCLAAAPRIARPLSWPAAVLLGEASYSLYLVHGTLLRALTLLRPSLALSLVGMAAMIGISVLMFRYLEEPARERIRANWKDRQARLRRVDPVLINDPVPAPARDLPTP